MKVGFNNEWNRRKRCGLQIVGGFAFKGEEYRSPTDAGRAGWHVRSLHIGKSRGRNLWVCEGAFFETRIESYDFIGGLDLTDIRGPVDDIQDAEKQAVAKAIADWTSSGEVASA